MVCSFPAQVTATPSFQGNKIFSHCIETSPGKARRIYLDRSQGSGIRRARLMLTNRPLLDCSSQATQLKLICGGSSGWEKYLTRRRPRVQPNLWYLARSGSSWLSRKPDRIKRPPGRGEAVQFGHLVHLDLPGQVGQHQVKAGLQAVAGALNNLDSASQAVGPGILPGGPDRGPGQIQADDPGNSQRGRGQAEDPGAAAHLHQAVPRPICQGLGEEVQTEAGGGMAQGKGPAGLDGDNLLRRRPARLPAGVAQHQPGG